MSRLTLTVLAGATIPAPVRPDVATRIRSVTVTEADTDRSVFSLVVDAGRSGPLAMLDAPILSDPTFRLGNRVVLVLTQGAVPQVLMDGIVTQTDLAPGNGANEKATLTVTGEDLSYLLDLEEKDVEHPAANDYLQVLKILASYAMNGIVPLAVPPLSFDFPLPIEKVPGQHDTDLRHLQALAKRNSYVTYLIPGPLPGTSSFYWGPPVRLGLPQPALSVGLGAQTNVRGTPKFTADALKPVTVSGSVQDTTSGSVTSVQSRASMRPPLAAMPLANVTTPRTRKLRESGVSSSTANARAQAAVDAGADASVVGEGELDGAAYGSVLRPRGLVGMRGAGWTYDGLWYVRKVVHQISPGSWTQKFTIAREGYGSTVPAVVV
jgi:hypothetical protein